MLKNLSQTEQTFLVIGGILLVIILVVVIIILINKLKKSNDDIQDIQTKKIDSLDSIEIPKVESIKCVEIPTQKNTIMEVEQPTLKKPESKFNIGEATKKLEENLENDNNIDLTKYEVEQEEKSIISYNELKRIVEEQKNNGVKVVSFDTPKKEEIKASTFNTEVLDFSDITSEYKFKPSEFVSPVNGIEKKDINKDILDIEKLDDNIKTSAEFLDALKELKNNLDL